MTIPKKQRPTKGADAQSAVSALKTSYFAKQATDAGITDGELCDAAAELQKGPGDYQSADIERMVKTGDLHEICKAGKEK